MRIEPCKKGLRDLCKHFYPTKMLVSPWDGRNWTIRQNICCSQNNIVYLIYCGHSDHKDSSWYVGSAVDMKKRWRNHRSDFINMKTTKSGLAQHAALQHPMVEKFKPITFLKVIFLESVQKEEKLLSRELWWQYNLGTLQVGLNKRKDTRAVSLQTSRLTC